MVISDGLPDSADAALSVAATYTNRIDTIFVGPEDDWGGGRAFLARLAKKSGGQYVTADRAQELAERTERVLLRSA